MAQEKCRIVSLQMKGLSRPLVLREIHSSDSLMFEDV